MFTYPFLFDMVLMCIVVVNKALLKTPVLVYFTFFYATFLLCSSNFSFIPLHLSLLISLKNTLFHLPTSLFSHAQIPQQIILAPAFLKDGRAQCVLLHLNKPGQLT